jgi:hypothetical protein
MKSPIKIEVAIPTIVPARPTNYRNVQRFAEELQENGLSGRADGFAYTDLANACMYGRPHDVHDTDAGGD